MALLKHRPLCIIILAVVLLMFIQAYLFSDAILIFGLASVVFIVVFALSLIRFRKHWVGMLLILFIAVGISGVATWRVCDKIILPRERIEKHIGSETTIEATVKDISYQSDYASTLTLYVEEIDGDYVGARVICECEYFADFYVSDVIKLNVTFLSIEELEAEGYYSDLSIRSNNFAAYCISSDDSAVLVERASGIYAEVLKLNRRICTELCHILGDGSGGLASALTLGNRAYLGDEISRDFARSGLAHILALSGTHVMLILGQSDKLLLSLFRLGKRGRAAVLILLTPLYVVFVLSSAPVVRAGLVYMMVCIAGMFGKRYDRITNTFIALLIMLLWDPAALFSVSLWMSFLAAISISAILPPLNDKLSSIRHTLKRRWVFDICRYVIILVTITLIGVISNILFSWLMFGTLSLVSVTANLIFGPILTLFLSMSVILVIFLPVGFVTSALAPIISAVGEFIIEGVSMFSKEEYAVISLRHDFAGVICVLFFVLLISFLLFEIRRRWLVLIPFASLVLAFGICFSVYLSNNTGSCVQVVKRDSNEVIAISSDGKYSLIDVTSGHFTTLSYAVELLKAKGACEIETLVLTHYHRYHAASLIRLFREEIVRNLVLPSVCDDYDTEVMERLVRIGKEYGVSVTFLSDAKYTEICGGVLMASLPYDDISRSTHQIINFRLLIGKNRLLYLGASFAEGKYRGECMRLASEADGVILGRHGPVPKKSVLYDCEYVRTDRQHVVTDADVGIKFSRIFQREYPFVYSAYPYTLIYPSE